MAIHVSELPCPPLPIRLVCLAGRRKATKQNSCPWQYKMSLHGGYGQLPQTCQEPVLWRTALQADTYVFGFIRAHLHFVPMYTGYSW